MRMERLEKGGGGRIKGWKGGKGEREEGAWWLVGYLPNLYLSPLIPL